VNIRAAERAQRILLRPGPQAWRNHEINRKISAISAYSAVKFHILELPQMHGDRIGANCSVTRPAVQWPSAVFVVIM
jgi:hypothetical protein